MTDSWNFETPLTASLERSGNLSNLKALLTGRIHRYRDVDALTCIRPDFPWTVGISPTTRCPRECFFCSHTKRNRLGHSLSDTVMQQIHADLRAFGTRGIIYAGGGDPLNWQGDIMNYIGAATQFCDVGIDTNGVLLDKVIASPQASRIFYVTVAMLAHEPKLYQQICGRNQFARVHRNVVALNELARTRLDSRLHVNVKLSVNQRSFRHFIDMCRYARGLGVHNVFARCMNNFERGQDIELLSPDRRWLFDTIVNEASFPADYANDFARNLLYPARLPADVRAPSRCWSVLLGHNLGIKPDGQCYLCVPTTGRPEFSIGNVNRQRVAELWGSPRHLTVMRRLDQRMQAGKCDPNRCRHYRLNLILERELAGANLQPPDSAYQALHASFL